MDNHYIVQIIQRELCLKHPLFFNIYSNKKKKKKYLAVFFNEFIIKTLLNKISIFGMRVVVHYNINSYKNHMHLERNSQTIP